MEPYPPSPYDPAPAPKSGAKAWQVILAAALGAFFGSVLVCGGGVALTLTYFQQQIQTLGNFASGNFNVPNFTYTLQAPADVVQHQPFEIQVTLENTGTSPMTVYSLDDYSGLTFQKSDPPWQSESYGEMIYQMTLSPNQPQTIKLTAVTSQLGMQTINIDANMDASGMSFAEGYASINVTATPANPPPAAEQP